MDKRGCAGCNQLKVENKRCLNCSNILCKKCMADHKCGDFGGKL